MAKRRVFSMVLMICTTLMGAADPQGQNNKQEPIYYVATFSNMEFTEEHAYGSRLELWKHNGEFAGLLIYSEGLAGDTPTGLLEDVRFDPRTRRLSFSAKLTTGVRNLGPGKEEPTRDLFVFSGTMGNESIAGELRRIDKLQPNAQPIIEKVVLKKETSGHGSPADTFKIKTLGDWKSYSGMILKRRGPKW